MGPMVRWFAKHIDGNLSLTGVLLTLSLVITGIGGILALSSGNTPLGIALIVVFLALLVGLTITALSTDPTLRMSKQEKAALWAKIPRFMRISIYILVGGQFAGFLAQHGSHWMVEFPFSALAMAISAAICARGMQVSKPPIPRPNQDPLSFQSAPEQYARHSRQIVFGFYFSAGVFLLLSLLSIWKKIS